MIDRRLELRRDSFISIEIELLGVSFAFTNSSFLLKVGRGRWLHEAELAVNKGTQNKARCAPTLCLFD